MIIHLSGKSGCLSNKGGLSLINKEVKKLKRLIIKLSYKSKEGHIASAFSILDILYILYDEILRNKTHDMNVGYDDKFILSKGHASLALYAILCKNGYFTQKELNTFCDYNSPFGGHPDKNKIPGVTASTGSLGHGLPVAVGIAMGNRIKGNDSKTFVLVGDGELNEGSNWEAILLAANHNLNNLICVVDHNKSTDRALKMDDLKNKFQSHGWSAVEIDGHNYEQIKSSLSKESSNQPLAIVAHTIKGQGIKKMENNPEWHHKYPNEKEYMEFIRELE